MSRDEAWKKWMEVLRDPSSLKKIGVLESNVNPNARCCLGHACHALIPETRRVTLPRAGSLVRYGADEWSAQVLPPELTELLGVDASCTFKKRVEVPRDRIKDTSTLNLSATALNDNTDLSPSEIADILERERDRGNINSSLPIYAPCA